MSFPSISFQVQNMGPCTIFSLDIKFFHQYRIRYETFEASVSCHPTLAADPQPLRRNVITLAQLEIFRRDKNPIPDQLSTLLRIIEMASLLRADHTRKFNLSFDNFHSFTFSELSAGEYVVQRRQRQEPLILVQKGIVL